MSGYRWCPSCGDVFGAQALAECVDDGHFATLADAERALAAKGCAAFVGLMTVDRSCSSI